MSKEKEINSLGVERIKDSFGIEMKYNPEFVYTILNRSHNSISMPLDHNWESIMDKGYDLFEYDGYHGGSINVSVNCDLKVKSQPDWPDRSSKIFDIGACLRWPSTHHPLESLAPNLQTELLSIGLDFEIVKETKKGEDVSYEETSLRLKNSEFSAKIHESYDRCYYGFRGHHSSTPEINLTLPYPKVDLTCPDDVKKCMSHFSNVLEKMVRVLYKTNNKHLPLQKLIFNPSEKAFLEKANVANCTYCKSDYSIVHGLSCPHCGASKPNFKIQGQ